MRGYFGVGVERLSKPRNAGAIFRTAHAFGAHFLFGIGADVNLAQIRKTDTADTAGSIPLWEVSEPAALDLPRGCQLVGIELTEDAVPLPSFRHPARAAYVLGSERSSLTPELLARCHHVVRIPTAFSLNVNVALALVLYDRMLSRGRFAERPVAAGGPTAPPAAHVHGGVFSREGRKDSPPSGTSAGQE
ncbi:RNA methyltransferase [Marivibrio halodurans]|uniref:RNA methyltransferase n=1 Tax=Marivibrio halodurans TaxID=2039722 RepID=A0A8J7V3Q4_9PROT|nr:RNA methyltransferase [Marivibrio halodurans]MBP5858630.1 RNA methyltransferase [Marivibrio halodurans]